MRGEHEDVSYEIERPHVGLMAEKAHAIAEIGGGPLQPLAIRSVSRHEQGERLLRRRHRKPALERRDEIDMSLLRRQPADGKDHASPCGKSPLLPERRDFRIAWCWTRFDGIRDHNQPIPRRSVADELSGKRLTYSDNAVWPSQAPPIQLFVKPHLQVRPGITVVIGDPGEILSDPTPKQRLRQREMTLYLMCFDHVRLV